ncbi:GNAT family N-acetyltransferase [Thalassotalea ganghwensis]
MTILTFETTKDLTQSAKLTLENMQEYYQQYRVDWQVEKVTEQISTLNNWDILLDGNVIGAIRLAFEDNHCYLRDLQVVADCQNQGFGKQALDYVITQAKAHKKSKLTLRVFKISPAIHLYQRNHFAITDEDEKFYYMERDI